MPFRTGANSVLIHSINQREKFAESCNNALAAGQTLLCVAFAKLDHSINPVSNQQTTHQHSHKRSLSSNNHYTHSCELKLRDYSCIAYTHSFIDTCIFYFIHFGINQHNPPTHNTPNQRMLEDTNLFQTLFEFFLKVHS